MNKKHVGSDFEDFLKEEGIFEEVDAAATKRALALQILELMKKKHMTKVELAHRMHTSRTSVDRLLDPKNCSLTLLTLGKAAHALRRELKLELCPAPR